MQAGEVGVLLKIFPNPQPPDAPAAVPVDLTGATCTLVCLRPDTGARITLSMVVTSAGLPTAHFASRVTQATDFPVDGNWLIQLVSTYTGGNKFISPQQTLVIGVTE